MKSRLLLVVGIAAATSACVTHDKRAEMSKLKPVDTMVVAASDPALQGKPGFKTNGLVVMESRPGHYVYCRKRKGIYICYD